MKLLLNLFLLAFVSATLHSTPPPGAGPSVPSVRWQDVETYIVSHATVIDPVAMAMLQAEVEAGQITWVLFEPMGGGGIHAPAPLNGLGLGWPAAGRVILFGTTAEATSAAALVVAATLTHPAGAVGESVGR